MEEKTKQLNAADTAPQDSQTDIKPDAFENLGDFDTDKDILLDVSPIGMIVWVTSFAFLGLLLIRTSHRTQYDISEVLLLFTMACIPVFGIFYYRFYTFLHSYSVLLALLFYFLSRYRFRL